jgi:hypothetical protein
MRNDIRIDRPSLITASLGGAAGAIVSVAVLQLAPLTGAALIDLPLLVGGVLTASPEAALWLGWIAHFIGAWLVIPLLLVALWDMLPGEPLSVAGALMKGAAAGLGVWIATGLALPLISALTRVEGVATPGLFALDAGLGAALALLVADLLYGLVLGAVSFLSAGLAPLNTLGWEDHSAGRSA